MRDRSFHYICALATSDWLNSTPSLFAIRYGTVLVSEGTLGLGQMLGVVLNLMDGGMALGEAGGVRMLYTTDRPIVQSSQCL